MVKLFIEGGGDSQEQRFEKTALKGRLPRLVAAGGRHLAYENLTASLAIRNDPYLPVILVDSEDLIDYIDSKDCDKLDQVIWTHLFKRDKWKKPVNCPSKRVFLMIATMENWMLADPEGLAIHYKEGFSLPNPPTAPEMLTKEQALIMLEAATKNCKSPYRKGIKDYGALASLNPAIIAGKCPSFKHFIECFPI